MNRKNIILIVFLSLFNLIYRINGSVSKELAAFSTIMAFSLLIWINTLLTIRLIIENNGLPKMIIYSIPVFLLVISHYWFISGSKLEKHADMANSLSFAEKITGPIILILLFIVIYILGTIDLRVHGN